MKENIDLTLKRDFNDVNDDFFETISRQLHFRFYKNKETPWRKRTEFSLINNDDELKDIELSYDDILITGNKAKRAERENYRKIYKNVCDCCGKPLVFPWKTKYGLCDKCNVGYPNKLNNIPWENQINFNQNLKRICWK